MIDSDNYEVYLKSVETQADLVKYAEGLDGVRQVNKSDVVADALGNVNVLIAYVSGGIILILLAVSIFLISNTVTMGITIRREEIAIMKYIGAKDFFCKSAIYRGRYLHRFDRSGGTACGTVLCIWKSC